MNNDIIPRISCILINARSILNKIADLEFLVNKQRPTYLS